MSAYPADFRYGSRVALPGAARTRWFAPEVAEILICLLFVSGFWLPQVFIDAVPKLDHAIVIGVAGLLIALHRGRLLSIPAAINGLFLIGLLLLFTLTSPILDIGYGISLHYLACVLVLCLRFPSVASSKLTSWVFVATNVLAIALGLSIVLHDPRISRMMIDYYSVYGVEKTSFLIPAGKPILTFGTHSVAGFVYMLLIWGNCVTAVIRKRRVFLVFAGVQIYLLYMLASTTSLVYTTWAAITFVWALSSSFRRGGYWCLAAGMLLACVALIFADAAAAVGDAVTSHYDATLSSEGSGFTGRYGNDGTVRVNLEKIEEFGFVPLGMAIGDRIMFGDSGVVEFFMRGSIFFWMGIYGGLAWFLAQNLSGPRRYTVLLFTLFMSFEFAYANMLHMRTLSILPFFVFYLRHVLRDDGGARC
jgi:hypothetical protein